MGGVVAGRCRQGAAASRGHKAGAVDRIVLKHHQGVEQLAQSGKTLDLRQSQMLMRHQRGLALLQLRQQRA